MVKGSEGSAMPFASQASDSAANHAPSSGRNSTVRAHARHTSRARNRAPGPCAGSRYKAEARPLRPNHSRVSCPSSSRYLSPR
jgi:hypothetical protein